MISVSISIVFIIWLGAMISAYIARKNGWWWLFGFSMFWVGYNALHILQHIRF